MKKGIFAAAWEEAMQKHKIYKKEKLKEMSDAKRGVKDEVSKRSTGILGGIGLYYLQRIEETFKNFFNHKGHKK